MTDQRLQDVTIYVCAVAIAVGISLIAFRAERQFGLEETGLLNTPYMVAHYGKAAFPVYGYWYEAAYDRLFVHPPTHYLAIGLLLKMGAGLYYAEAIPVLFFILLSVYLISSARLPYPLKLGLLLGYGAAMGVCSTLGRGDFFFHLRPDAHAATAWFAGLLLLDRARQRNWSVASLFAGALVLTYASTIHYFALLGFLGAFVYLGYAARDLTRAKLTVAVGAVAAGGLLIGVPFLVRFVLYNLTELIFLNQSYQAQADWISDIANNFTVYPGLVSMFEFVPAMLYALPLKWTLAAGVPVFAAAAALLLCFRDLRPLTFAALPLPLFIFFYSPRKLFSYLYPEMILFLCGLWVVLAAAAIYGAERSSIRPLRRYLGPALAACFLLMFVARTPPFRSVHTLGPAPNHEMMTIRAAALDLVGPNATVASQHSLWYMGGAQNWLDLTKDIFWQLPQFDLKTYFSRLSAVAVLSESFVNTSTGMNEVSLYDQGIVRLRGFFVARNFAYSGPCWFSSNDSRPVQGFFPVGDELHRFVEDPQGGYTLLSAFGRMEAGEAVRIKSLGFLTTSMILYLPNDEEPGQGAIALLLVPDEQKAEAVASLPPQMVLRDSIAGRVEAVNLPSLMDNLDNDGTIRFPRSYNEAVADQWLSENSDSSSQGYAIIWEQVYTEAQVVATSGRPPGTSVVSDITPFSLLRSKSFDVKAGQHYLISHDLKIDRGGVTINVLKESDDQPLLTVRRSCCQDFTAERAVLSPLEDETIYLVVTAHHAPLARGKVEAVLSGSRIREIPLTP